MSAGVPADAEDECDKRRRLTPSAEPHSSDGVTQVILSTAHPAKFSSAVEDALSSHAAFNFERDVLPKEFAGLLEKERRVIDVEGADPELTKKIVMEQVEKLYGQSPKAPQAKEEPGASV